MSKWPLVLLLCSVLVGCGSKLVYHNLDWFVIEYAEDFVDLNRQQITSIEQALPPLLQWHRSQELPLYLEQVDALLALTLREVTIEQMVGHRERVRQHYERLVRRVLPTVTELAATLTPDQTEQFMAAFLKRNVEFAEKYRAMDESQLRQFYQDRIKEDLVQWLGTLSDEQMQLVKEWSLNIQSTVTDWAVVQSTVREQIRVLLDARQQPEVFQRHLEQLLLHSEQWHSPILKAKLAYNRGLAQRYLLEILQISSEPQQQHFREELQDWKEIGLELVSGN